MAITYIKLGPEGTIFNSEELGIFLDKNNATEIDESLVATRLRSFFLTGFLVRISKIEYDNIKLKNSNARNAPLVVVNLAGTPIEEPVENILNIPPTNPIRNKRYLVWDKPTASWENYENTIAMFTGTSWRFIEPKNGTILPVYALGISARYQGTYPSGTWIIGNQPGNTTPAYVKVLEMLNSSPETPTNPDQIVPQWVLDITQEDIERWNTNSDNPDPSNPPEDNTELWNALSYFKGYLFYNDNKLSVGYADEAGDSKKWAGKDFSAYLDQAVKTTSNVKHKSIESSKAFTPGFTGAGWKVDENGDATFDNLTVRKAFKVYELIINKITGSNGALAVTDSIELDSVVVDQETWVCYIDTKDNTIQVPFHIDDLVRCQMWNGTDIKYYYAQVTNVQTGRFSLSMPLVAGTGVPAKGDTLHRFGNISDIDRQGLLYLTSSDAGAPYMDVLDGITSPDLSDKTKVRLGRLDGITDPAFGPLEGYGLYTQNGYFTGKITVVGSDSNVPTKDDLDAKIGITDGFTRISGGLIFTNSIFLGTLEETVTGMTGVIDMGLNSIMIWSGTTFEDRLTAPFRVSLGGETWMTNAHVAGVIEAESGNIGFLQIGTNSLYVGETDDTWVGETISITPGYSLFRLAGAVTGQTRQFAYDLYSNMLGSPETEAVRITNDIDNYEFGGVGSNVALRLDAGNADNAYALDIGSGKIRMRDSIGDPVEGFTGDVEYIKDSSITVKTAKFINGILYVRGY